MRPVPLHSPWRDRRHRLYALLVWMLVGLLLTRPQTQTGVFIALGVFPLLGILALLLHRWWINRFARSNLMHAIYVGPKLVGTWKDRLAADLGVDIPVRLDNSAFQVVPDVRVRAGVTWRF